MWSLCEQGPESARWPPVIGLWSGGSGTKLLTLRFQKEHTYSPALPARRRELTPCRKWGSYKQGSWWGALKSPGAPHQASSRAHCWSGPPHLTPLGPESLSEKQTQRWQGSVALSVVATSQKMLSLSVLWQSQADSRHVGQGWYDSYLGRVHRHSSAL